MDGDKHLTPVWIVYEYVMGQAVQHPLEWDKELFKPERFRHLSDDNFKRLSKKMELLDIWKGGGDGGIKGAVEGADKNYFWFAHPVYFMKHLDDAGLLSRNAENLKMVQDVVLNLKCLKKSAKGIYPEVYEKLDSTGQTYCNHGAYLTIKAVDANYKNFINYPSVYVYDDPPYSRSAAYNYKPSSYWCDFLKEQAERGVIKELYNQDDALHYANLGYVVIIAWKNPNKRNEARNAPHFATVRPGIAKNDNGYITIANVGEDNDVMFLSKGFPGINEIKFYYNPGQSFRYKPDEVTKYDNYE
jgi:hypothetical protein